MQICEKLITFAKLFAERLEKGEGDVPILVKHSSGVGNGTGECCYLAGFRSLKGLGLNQPVLEAVSSEGDADAVAPLIATLSLFWWSSIHHNSGGQRSRDYRED